MTAAHGKPGPATELPANRQRLDKWLWFARVVKTRSLAARLVSDGHVRVNAVRVDNPAKGVRAGDVLTVALERGVRVLRVVQPGERRGPFTEARTLFDDLSGPARAEDDAEPETGDEEG